MLSQPASLLSIPLLILDSGPNTPAKQITPPPSGHTSHPDGPFTSRSHILQLAESCDILTVEIEHVDADVLAEVEAGGKCAVHPSAGTIKLIQDKYAQKEFFWKKHGIPVAPYLAVPGDASSEHWEQIEKELGMPVMLKSRKMAYDGKGNSPLRSIGKEDVEKAIAVLPASKAGKGVVEKDTLYAEKWIPFVKEVAVMVVRNVEGEVRSYDAVETIHKDSILRVGLAPLRMHDWDSKGKGKAKRGEKIGFTGEEGESVNAAAKALAEKAVGVLEGAGVFGVEMFLLEDGQSTTALQACGSVILIFLDVTLYNTGSLIINEIAPRPHNSGHHTIEACHSSQFENHLRAILSLPLGSTSLRVPSTSMINLIGTSSSIEPIEKVVTAALGVEGATVHLYGKAECRKGRKMGHITVTGANDAIVREKTRTILSAMEDMTEEWITNQIGPDPTKFSVPKSHPQPLVGIIMGSDSDLPTMIPAARILDAFKIPYELTIVSAHRTPQRMVDYARKAAGRGLRVIIAGAGGAAHLPGMVASETALPVVGVPVKGSVLDGVDSLYSIVQMPVRSLYVFWVRS